jgi:HEAT repeat protein
MIYACLNDPASDVRAVAAIAVATLENDQSKVLDTLIPLADDTSGRMRRAVATVLPQYGAAARPAVPALVRMLSRENERNDAMKALKIIGVETLPDLQKMLAVKDSKVRMFACEALGLLGPAAKDAAPQLRDLLNQDSSLRGPITAALAKIEGNSPVTP